MFVNLTDSDVGSLDEGEAVELPQKRRKRAARIRAG